MKHCGTSGTCGMWWCLLFFECGEDANLVFLRDKDEQDSPYQIITSREDQHTQFLILVFWTSLNSCTLSILPAGDHQDG